MLVVVAAEPHDQAKTRDHLRRLGAATITLRDVGQDRILVYGGPFNDRTALEVADELRLLGWPADARPEAGGHLKAWQAHTAPITAGRLLVCFPWSECDRNQTEIAIEIDPGRAFGSGSHPTTHLLLKVLAESIKGGETLLDVGCGSGVLAIAAARLGAQVTATDIAPEAIKATEANAKRNHVETTVHVTDTPINQLPGTFDVIVANIEAHTLRHLAPAIQAHLKRRGWLALSGLSPAQLSKVAAAYNHLHVASTLHQEDWSALIATAG